MAQKTKTSRLPYMPSLDGLRGLAILAVLFYHADLPWMPGGFLGVEVFFVLSGYLITSSLLAEWREQGSVNLAAFWKRRAYRLFPALVLLVSVTLVFAAIWLSIRTASLHSDALASLGYVSNWHFIIAERPYFEVIGRPSLMRHTWALAVEGQFYLLWVPIFIWTMKRGSRNRLLGITIFGSIASTLLMMLLFQPNADLSRVYYGTDTRLSGLLIGAALACVWPPRQSLAVESKTRSWLFDILGLSTLMVLVVACWRVNEFHIFLYKGGFAGVALLTAATIGASVHPRARLVSKLLSSAPLRWLGERSYGIYLWHWPIFMVTRPRLDLLMDGLPLLMLRLAITGVIAECSYQFIERPIRYGTKPWTRRLRPSILWGMSIVSLVAVIVLVSNILVISSPVSELASLFSLKAEPTAAISTPDDTKTLAAQTDLSERQNATGTSQPPTPTETPSLSPTITSSLLSTAATSLPKTLKPTSTPTPIPYITAFGDSVMAGASQTLSQTIMNIHVDAAEGRQIYETIWMLKEYYKNGQLGDIVVIHIGSNGIFRGSHFDEIMEVLADVPKVVFVNVQVPRRWQDPINEMLTDYVAKYPNALLADWYTISHNHPEYLINDGVHLTDEGKRVYAEFIAASVKSPLENLK